MSNLAAIRDALQKAGNENVTTRKVGRPQSSPASRKYRKHHRVRLDRRNYQSGRTRHHLRLDWEDCSRIFRRLEAVADIPYGVDEGRRPRVGFDLAAQRRNTASRGSARPGLRHGTPIIGTPSLSGSPRRRCGTACEQPHPAQRARNELLPAPCCPYFAFVGTPRQAGLLYSRGLLRRSKPE